MEWHYLDHAASTPMRPEAIEAMRPLLADGYGNPSGAHALARAARDALDEARAALAAVAGCAPGELVFTSGGTEADNLAVRGVLAAAGAGQALAAGAAGRAGVAGAGRADRAGRSGGHIVPAGGEQGDPGAPVTAVCSAIEHPAVLEVVDAVGGRTVGVDRRGVVDLELLARVLEATPGVGLVSVMLVNNEVGTVQPIDAIAAVVREWAPQAVLHTDAAQALCWLDVADHTRAADLVTLAAHKCGGPRGIGALVVRDGVRLAPQQLGGGQERGRRSGTNDVASAVAFAVAARAAAADREALLARASAWRAELVDAVRAVVPGVLESAVPEPGRSGHVVPGIVNLCLPTVHSEALLFLLEHDHRVLASAGSSCASGAQEPSHVLAALGIDRALAEGSLRLSMGWSTTAADIAAAVVGVPDAVRKLQAHAHDGAPA